SCACPIARRWRGCSKSTRPPEHAPARSAHERRTRRSAYRRRGAGPRRWSGAVSNLESTPSQRRAALMRRAVVLLACDPPAPLGELDGLLTDACAMVLALQRVG